MAQWPPPKHAPAPLNTSLENLIFTDGANLYKKCFSSELIIMRATLLALLDKYCFFRYMNDKYWG